MGDVDCAEWMLQFKQRCPDAESGLKPDMFTASVPGCDAHFPATSLCHLMDAIERWAAEQTMARLLLGTAPAERQGTTDDRLPVLMRICHRRPGLA
jgi:hypothetical protein